MAGMQELANAGRSIEGAPGSPSLEAQGASHTKPQSGVSKTLRAGAIWVAVVAIGWTLLGTWGALWASSLPGNFAVPGNEAADDAHFEAFLSTFRFPEPVSGNGRLSLECSAGCRQA